MKLKGKFISLVLTMMLTGILLNSCATNPKPVGALDRDQVIERYFKNRNLDEIEGIWVRDDKDFEFAILKNSFEIYPGYDYIGIVTDTDSRDWEIGETKLLIKNTSDVHLYSVSYFDDRAKVTKSENKGSMTVTGGKVAKIDKSNDVLIKNYPQPEAFCRIGFESGENNLRIWDVSPYARKVGLLHGDILKSIDGIQVLTDKDVNSMFNKKRAGEYIKVGVERNQQMVEVEAVCKDGRKWLQEEIELLVAEATDTWSECISKTYDADLEYGELLSSARLRLDCAERDFSIFTRQNIPLIAMFKYDYIRKLITEYTESLQSIGTIRVIVLSSIDWLDKNDHASLANDLRTQWEASTKVNKIVPVGKESISSGTGFIVSPDGLILTAYHVVDGAKSIQVNFQDGRFFEAFVQQSSKSTDLAVLRVSAVTPDYLPLVSTRTSKVGEAIFTMGFPFKKFLGKEPKFTDGTISALSGKRDESTFFQMSVPVQPGNSGGPVVNNRGEVIGVVTSTAAILPFLSNTGTLPQNINWAVKSDYAIPLFNAPSQLSPSPNREAAIERVRNALCAIEVINKD